MWMSTVGFRKHKEANSGKCLQRGAEEGLKVTGGHPGAK